jgi:hypothetical protein
MDGEHDLVRFKFALCRPLEPDSLYMPSYTRHNPDEYTWCHGYETRRMGDSWQGFDGRTRWRWCCLTCGRVWITFRPYSTELDGLIPPLFQEADKVKLVQAQENAKAYPEENKID